MVQAFDQDLWAKPYPRLASRAAVRALVALRAWNLSYFRTFTAEDLARVGMHPERGEESVQMLIRMQAGHDRNHLVQLDALAAIPSPSSRTTTTNSRGVFSRGVVSCQSSVSSRALRNS